MTLGDRVAVMCQGRLEQVGAPLEVYQRPASRFVASFLGSPEINLLPARIQEDRTVACGGLNLHLPDLPAQLAAGQPVVLGIRPQDVLLAGSDRADARVRLEVIEPLGPAILCHARLDGEPLRLLLPDDQRPVEGQELPVRLRRDRLHLFHPDGPRLNTA